MLRTAQQGPEALRASAVEAAFTERRRGEAGREIAIEPRDRFVRTGVRDDAIAVGEEARGAKRGRSEEHTSELQSLMRISYAVFCLKKKKKNKTKNKLHYGTTT